jgi:hypothetical protein
MNLAAVETAATLASHQFCQAAISISNISSITTLISSMFTFCSFSASALKTQSCARLARCVPLALIQVHTRCLRL